MVPVNHREATPAFELTLDEIFAEPMVKLMMQRDGVLESQMRGIFSDALRKSPESH